MLSHTPIQRILIAVDFTEPARQAFYVGINMASMHGAEAYVLHVSEPIRSFDFTKRKYIETKETIDRVEEGIKRRVDELWKDGGIEAVDRRKVHVLVRGGNAAQEIVETAKVRNIDVIVIGKERHNQGAVGSTTERVVRQAPCSVYCVQRP